MARSRLHLQKVAGSIPAPSFATCYYPRGGDALTVTAPTYKQRLRAYDEFTKSISSPGVGLQWPSEAGSIPVSWYYIRRQLKRRLIYTLIERTPSTGLDEALSDTLNVTTSMHTL